MSWTGVLTGGALGALLGGPLGALVGAAIGHLATSDATKNNAADGEGDAPAIGEKQAVFIVALFSTLAKLAIADGELCRSEVDVVRSFIDHNFRPEQREFVNRIFETALDDGEPYASYIDQMNVFCGDDREFKQRFLGVLCELAQADGVIHPGEREILLYAEQVFSLNGYVDTFFGYGPASAHDRAAESLDVCYDILGCTEAASDSEVKTAYRRKSRDFHPDRLRSKGLPDELVSFGEKEMQRINLAYDTVRRARGMAK
ncbi:MAG: TerB family tellurite resistance protein [Victivallaceae bacterium]|nr:TerB family tellurite resistance protein [Victivallaceae bacterium]